MSCRVTLLLVFGLLFCSIGSSRADMYKYTDDSGSVCMTNSLESVPKKYRGTMTVIREEKPTQKKLLPEVQKRTTDPLPQAAPEPQSAVTSAPATDTGGNNRRNVTTALLAGGIVAGFFLLRWLGSAVGAPRTGLLLFLVLSLAGCVYLYNLYIVEMRSMFSGLRKDALNMKSNVESRQNKTDQMLKKQEEKERRDAEAENK
jgi:hypothetical protein